MTGARETWERADTPWHMVSSRYKDSEQDPMGESNRHRGWTLVESGRWMYAVKGPKRIRLCRDGMDPAETRRIFRARVDAEEDA